ncbi:hypothetical protein PAMA_005013 [Pampus argenteus]
MKSLRPSSHDWRRSSAQVPPRSSLKTSIIFLEKGPCKPLDLLAKRGLCLAGLPPKSLRLLVGVRRENPTVKDDKTNESLCQTRVASMMTDGGELSLRRSAGFILE